MSNTETWQFERFRLGKKQIWAEYLLSIGLVIGSGYMFYFFFDYTLDVHFTLRIVLAIVFVYAFLCGIEYLISLYRARRLVHKITVKANLFRVALCNGKILDIERDDVLSVINPTEKSFYQQLCLLKLDSDKFTLKLSQGLSIYLSNKTRNLSSLVSELNKSPHINCQYQSPFGEDEPSQATSRNGAGELLYSVDRPPSVLVYAVIIAVLLFCLFVYIPGCFEGDFRANKAKHLWQGFTILSILYLVFIFIVSMYQLRFYSNKIKVGDIKLTIVTPYLKVFDIRHSQVKSFDALKSGGLFSLRAFISRQDENYILTTTCGKKFYVSGLPGTIDDLVERLNGLAAKNTS